MAEDEGKKEEEKFDLTQTGESLGYITLEQARIQAIQHARDNTGFYGPRYARVNLVWEVANQEEGEEFYDIRLSFRPAGRFQGEPGIEQLIIDKTGNIQLRQILDEPSDLGQRLGRGPRWLLPSAVGLIVIGVVAVGALLGSGIIAGGPTSTPAPAPAPTLSPTATTVAEREELAVVTPAPTGTPIVVERPVVVTAPPAPTPTPVILQQDIVREVQVIVTPTPEPTPITLPTPPPRPGPDSPPEASAPTARGDNPEFAQDCAAVPEGTTVSAWIDGSLVASATVRDGRYVLIVDQGAQGDFSGKTVTFMVGELDASQRVNWASGAAEELDLTGIIPLSPWPAPTPTASSAAQFPSVGVLAQLQPPHLFGGKAAICPAPFTPGDDGGPGDGGFGAPGPGEFDAPPPPPDCPQSAAPTPNALHVGVLAQPMPPGLFSGTATIDCFLAADGTVVDAWMEGGQVASTTVKDGRYFLIVEEPSFMSYAGQTVRFTIGGHPTNETVMWEPGGSGELDLTAGQPVSAPAPLSAPVPDSRIRAALAPLIPHLVRLWHFDNATKHWGFYDPSAALAPLNTVTEMANGESYWIRLVEDQTVTLNGIQRNLYAGWNVMPWGRPGTEPVGGPSPPGTEQALAPLILRDNLVRVWHHDNIEKLWSFYDPRPAFAAANTLKELAGFEVYMIQVVEEQTVVLNGHRHQLIPGWNFITW